MPSGRQTQVFRGQELGEVPGPPRADASVSGPSTPPATTAHDDETAVTTAEAKWGGGMAVDGLAPSLTDKAGFAGGASTRAELARSGQAAENVPAQHPIDVRATPWLCPGTHARAAQAREKAMASISGAGRYVAGQVAGACFVELAGASASDTERVDTAGAAFLATLDGPARPIQCAPASRDAVRRLRPGGPVRAAHR